MSRIRGRGVVGGRARGPALLGREPISFLGDLDIRTGEVVGDLASLKGRRLGGRVLVVPSTMGSAGAWRFLYQLHVHGQAPVALVTVAMPDPSVVQGAILAEIPILAQPEADLLELLEDGEAIEVDGDEGVLRRLDP